jgi:hypothetical protein
MTILPVAMATTGAAAILNFWLATRVGQVRRATKISVGDGGNPQLIARMRAQLNFAEYTPVVLILIALIELAGGTHLWLWGVAAAYVIGRVCHAFGMDGWYLGRQIGTTTTMLGMLGLGVYAAIMPFILGAPIKLF